MIRSILVGLLFTSICGQAVECAVTAERILPSLHYLKDQQNITVKIEFTGEADSVIIEETIPPGWTVSRARSGTVNGRTVTWELTSSDLSRGIIYYVNASATDESDAHFSGTVNGNPVGGDGVMMFRPLTPTPGKQVPVYGPLYNYWLYLPSAYLEQEDPWPLFLFLHGGCASGTDLDLVLTHYNVSILRILENPDNVEIVPELFHSIVVSPQSTDRPWDIHRLRDLLTELFSIYSVDPDRVYLYGHAEGGDAGWAMANEFPDLLAAFSSGGMLTTPPTVTANMAGLPVWVLEIELFEMISHDAIQTCVNQVKALGNECVYTLIQPDGDYKVADHYYNRDVYRWFLQQNRQSRMSGVEYWQLY